jgi:hypothetical protein
VGRQRFDSEEHATGHAVHYAEELARIQPAPGDCCKDIDSAQAVGGSDGRAGRARGRRGVARASAGPEAGAFAAAAVTSAAARLGAGDHVAALAAVAGVGEVADRLEIDAPELAPVADELRTHARLLAGHLSGLARAEGGR